ncbi:MAG: T9SS type A sorting domain-containing protein [Bacteroidota bacterium]
MQLRLLTSLALLIFSYPLFSQQLVPLEGFEMLAPPPKLRPAETAKASCDFEDLPFERVRTDETIGVFFELDTFGFGGPNSDFVCLNCDEAAFGDASVDGTQLSYTGSAISQGIDSIQVSFGDTLTMNFADPVVIPVLSQRPNIVFDNPVLPVGPQETVNQDVILQDLPGGPFCFDFVDDDDYTGRGQLFDFVDADDITQGFTFRSARLAGLDRLGVRVCNEFDLCDTYYYFFRVVRENVDPPFFDDFSYDAIRPDLELWQDEEVLINRNYGILAPSVGVATFDGVGPFGQAYAPPGGGVSISRDFLTSAGINLAGQSGYVLTFYAQPRGLGNRPEFADSLVLQFRGENGNWRTVWSEGGLSNGEPDDSDRPFIGYTIPLQSQDYYNGFSFRFFNLSNESGARDNWNLDYVRLDNIATTLSLADIAFLNPPRHITRPYTAMPYRHLVSAGPAEVQTELAVDIWNHLAGQDLRVNASSLVIEELQTGQIFFNTNLLDGPEADIAPSIPIEKRFDMPSTAPFSSGYQNYVDALLDLPNTAEEQYEVRTNYTMTIDEETDRPGVVASVQSNNQVEQVTTLSNYFSYDDGSSELAIEAQPNQRIVQEYDAFVPDVLRGVSIRFPRTSANVANQEIEVEIYLGELDNSPDYSFPVTPVYVEDFFIDSLQGFTTYALPDSVDIPVGKFYVGWRQVSACNICVPVGYDRNNNTQGRIFFRANGGWFPFITAITGSVMIRPIVGSETVPSTSSTAFPEDEDLDWLTIYPNPTNDRVWLQTDQVYSTNQIQWAIFDMSGRMIDRGTGTEISLDALLPGTYILRAIDDRGQISRQKLLKTGN